MKELNITPKVIELAKEITKHWRMEIYVGCWYIQGNESKARLYQGDGLFIDGKKIQVFGDPIKYVSIPSISDCLEKLRELGYESTNLIRRSFQPIAKSPKIPPVPWLIDIWDKKSHNLETDTIKRWRNKGETLHEALLSVLLEALKED